MSFKNSVLITGGTLNLGYYAALAIARKHPEYLVVVASRTDPKSAATTINNTLHQKNVLFMPLDLGSFAKIRSFVNIWESKKYPPIIALLLNAGLRFPKGIKYTEDGFEATFGVNHVGHALLFHLLFPFLADNARIVITSSGTHDPAQKAPIPDPVFITPEGVAHPAPGEEQLDGRGRYSTSKLANIYWTYALNRRLPALESKGKHLTAVAFDPGLMPGTGLAREGNAIERFLWNIVGPRIIWVLRRLVTANTHTPQESGESLAWVAVGDEVKNETGVYFEGRKKIKSSVDSYDEKKQEDLWEWTVKNVSTSEEQRKAFDIGK
jgi:NAD(P)-dependent dehydrogenase (short-subunit alcohol dehydrogenase family)